MKYPLKHFFEKKKKKKIERTGMRGKTREQLLDNVMETRRYWKMKEEVNVALSG